MSRGFLILSMPRSGSSSLAKMLHGRGITPFAPRLEKVEQSPSEYNPSGYFESTLINLLNDQLIRLISDGMGSFLNNSFVDQFRVRPPELSGVLDYDLNERHVEMPPDYTTRLKHYTGNEWDVWGLTRMLDGGKWRSAYSQSGISNTEGVLSATISFQREWAEASSQRIYLKDPRMVYTLHSLNLDAKLLVIRRNLPDTLESMRNHYGPRLFTELPFQGYSWVSNHFNYRVPPQSFEHYVDNFERSIKLIKLLGYEMLELELDDLNQRDKLDVLLGDFLC